MSDRYHSLTVVLEEDISEEYANAIITGIMMMKFVVSVQGEVANAESHMAEHRAMRKYFDAIAEVLKIHT